MSDLTDEIFMCKILYLLPVLGGCFSLHPEHSNLMVFTVAHAAQSLHRFTICHEKTPEYIYTFLMCPLPGRSISEIPYIFILFFGEAILHY